MQDHMIKATAYDHQVRAYAVHATNTIEEVRRRHQLMPLAATAMGRAMTATVLLSSMLKGNDQITVNISGGGPIGSILIDANTTGNVRGYLSNPNAYVDLNEHNQLDIAAAVGSYGTMTVTRRNGNNTPFIGQIPIITGEIGDEFSFYLSNSEQIPAAVGVSTQINSDFSIQTAGGFMIQLLPGTDGKVIHEIEARIAANVSLSEMLQQNYLPEDILKAIFGEHLQIMEKMPVQFQCECSRERIANAIISLGRVEIEDMIATDGQANAECHFCNEHYLFTAEDLNQLLKVAK